MGLEGHTFKKKKKKKKKKMMMMTMAKMSSLLMRSPLGRMDLRPLDLLQNEIKHKVLRFSFIEIYCLTQI